MARSDILEDIAFLIGIGVVGVMAYQAWYRGKNLEEVTADIDTKVRAFLDDILSKLPALPPIPTIQFPTFQPSSQQYSPPAPADDGQSQPQPGFQQISDTTTPGPNMTADSTPVSIIGIAGDWQNASATKSVLEAMEKNNVQFIIAAGDYNSGNIGSALNPKYKNNRIRGAKGNHDGGSDYQMFGQSSWNTATKINQLVGVVTMDNNGISEAELDKLTAQLKNEGCKIIIYDMHMPCVTSPGDHHGPSENKGCPFITKVAAKYGVQLLVNGHNHYYARFQRDGITYCTIGTAGGETRPEDGKGGSALKIIKGKYGFVKCITQGNSLNCQFIDASSNAVLDTFTISGSAPMQLAAAYRRFNQYRPQSNIYSMFLGR